MLMNSREGASLSNLEHNFLKDKTDSTSEINELTQTNKMNSYNTHDFIITGEHNNLKQHEHSNITRSSILEELSVKETTPSKTNKNNQNKPITKVN